VHHLTLRHLRDESDYIPRPGYFFPSFAQIDPSFATSFPLAKILIPATATATRTSMATQRILAAADHNNHLLDVLSRTDYAAPELSQTIEYASGLKAILAKEEKKVQKLVAATVKEHHEHESYRDSTMRRLAYKLSGQKGKFNEKAEKEEREWLEAIQNELQAKRAVEHLKANLVDAEATASRLRAVVDEHQAAQSELDALYNSIFSGPSPEFPNEDFKEGMVKAAKATFEEVQQRLSMEAQAREVLGDAELFMGRCIRNIEDALHASTMDAWGIGGSFADMNERSALAQAQSHASQVEMLVSQARRMQPIIQALGPLNIAQGNLMSDIIFDNVFSDMAFHDKINDSKAQVLGAAARLRHEVQHSEERLGRLKAEVKEKKLALEEKRRELQDERRSVFERISSDLPSYSAELTSNDDVSLQRSSAQHDVHSALYGAVPQQVSNQPGGYNMEAYPPTYDSYSRSDYTAPPPPPQYLS
jgi:hypothetical protein